MGDRTNITEELTLDSAIEVLKPLGPEITNRLAAAVTPHIEAMRAYDTGGEYCYAPLSDRHIFPALVVRELADAGLLRADPDTSDERKPCPHCNDEGMVCTLDGDIIGPCDCTSDELFAEARRLLDAATPGPWERPSSTANWFTVPQPIQIDEADWGQEAQENGAMCGYRIGTLADERAWRYADAELIAAAPRLIATLLERAVTAEADRGEAERRERTAVNLANYHRDVARTAGGRAEHAEAEARQLREAIGDPKKLRLTAMSVRSVSRSASLHLHRIADAAAVAEGAEDRGQTHTQNKENER